MVTQQINMADMDALDLLRAAGWYPGRRVDASDIQRFLAQEGHRVHAAAKAVLSEFSGLTIDGPDPALETHRRQRHLVIGAEAIMEGPGPYCDYSEAIGEAMIPVGGEFHMTVMIGERGTVWGAYSGAYGFIADSFVSAVGRILLAPPSEWSLDRRLPPGPDAEERIRRRQLEDERHQAGGWRRFWGRRM